MDEKNVEMTEIDEKVQCLEKGIMDTKTVDHTNQSAFSMFKTRLKKDRSFQKKFIIFLSLCYSFFILGINIGQFGPTLLDLQKITRCSLDKAAFFFNAHTLGYLASSILTGVTFERFNKLLQMFFPCFFLSLVNVAIPWCTIYELMVTVHFLKGFCLGFLDAVGNAILLHLLAQGVKTYMQILHFMFAFGGIISPIISAPFLSSESSTNGTTSYSGNLSVILNSTTATLIQNVTNFQTVISPNLTESFNDNETVSTIASTNSYFYIAYTISAIMSLSSAIPFLVLYCESDESTCPTSQNQSEEHKKENIPLRLKISVLVVLSFIIAFYTAMEDTYAGFLTTFTVKHLKWSKPQGSFATSVFWTSFAVGRFSGIFIVNIFRQTHLLRVYSILIIGSFICLLVTALHFVGVGIWIASIIAGFGMSIFFPIFFSWTEEKFFHVDGKVTALIMTCAMLGVIINPIILARVMETSPIWFGYVLLVESGLLFLFYGIGVYIAKLIKRDRLKSAVNQNGGIEVEAVDPLIGESKL